MNDPSTWSLCALSLGVLIKGTLEGLSKSGRGEPHGWSRVASRFSVVLIAAGLAIGLVRSPLAVRPNATHPPTRQIAFVGIVGGENLGGGVVRPWESAGLDFSKSRLVKPEEACAQYPELPLFCAPAQGLPRTLEGVLRASADEVGAHEVASACTGNDGLPTIVTDRFDNLHDIALPDTSAHDITLFGRAMTVSAAGADNARRLILQAKDGGESVSIAISPGVEAHGRYPLDGHHVRFRVESRVDADGTLRVGFVDLHLECA